jgi:signal transduction histidine kinase/CheY-like chemotaxis protein
MTARPFLGWLTIAALAFGGANQSVYVLDVLIGGQAGMPGQGAASLVLLGVGFLLVCLAAPGWLELVLMSPHRVGGIGAACADAFRPYSPLLAALAGFCNWWAWAATCGLGATALAAMIGPAYLPDAPQWALACAILAVLTTLALSGLRIVRFVAVLAALAVLGLAGASVLLPLRAGAFSAVSLVQMPLSLPFTGSFGAATAIMSSLFLVGYAAPCMEAALTYTGLARRPGRDAKWALLVILLIGGGFFIALPVIWYGVLGPAALAAPLEHSLSPLFTGLPGLVGRLGALALITLCWVQTSIHGLCGAPLTVAQLADDGMAPRIFSRRSKQEVPVAATLLTSFVAGCLVLINDTTWLQGAANFAYLIGIFLPSLAVLLLRRDQPDAERPFRAARGFVSLGLCAGVAWLLAAVLGAQQFGLPIIVFGLAMAYSGAGVFALRKLEDRRRAGGRGLGRTLYLDVMVILLIVLILDGAGYIVALSRFGHEDAARTAELTDIFVAVALLSLGVSVVLPGRIAYATEQVGDAARRLAFSTLRDFSAALDALGRGDLEDARMKAQITPLPESSGIELGELARSFNVMQAQLQHAANGLENARTGLMRARDELTATNAQLLDQIHEQERLTAELVIARDSAKAGERSKTEFLAMMSHELRTPLNGVIGLIGLLLDGNLDAQSRHYAKMMREAGDHLLDLINDLLDLTRMEAGKIHFEESDFELEAVVQAALDLVAPRAQAKSLELGAFVSPDIPRRLTGDPGRLRQVMINLLGNAVKFTAAGNVVLEVQVLTVQDGEVRLGFSVADTGIGIAAQDIPHLFEVFSQLDHSTSRRFGGTGLGLAISQRIVSGMGGTISVESTLGEGSIFRFEVSMKIAPPQMNAPEGAPPGPGSARLHDERILVLHAGDGGGSLLARQIESRGGKVQRAASTAAALALLRAEKAPFHAILVDQGLPDAGAEKFAAQVRSLPRLAGVRLVLAGSTEFAPEKPGASHFDARLLKPVPVDTLIFHLAGDGTSPPQAAPSPATASRSAGVAAPGMTPSPPPQRVPKPVAQATPDPAGPSLHILVAEDNLTNQAVIRAMLGKLKHSFDIVANGLEAVDAARSNAYDLILMDVMMPELDGINATARIRKLPGPAARVPVVALTADVSASNHAAFNEACIHSILSKPVTLRALGSLLAKFEPAERGENRALATAKASS